MHKCCKCSPCSGSLSVPGCRANPVDICKVLPGGQAFSCSWRVLKASELCSSPYPFTLMPRRSRNHLYFSHSVPGGGAGPSATSGGTTGMKHGAQQNCVTHETNSIQSFCGRLCLGKLLAWLENTTMWYFMKIKHPSP